jgi:hypothetical protein
MRRFTPRLHPYPEGGRPLREYRNGAAPLLAKREGSDRERPSNSASIRCEGNLPNSFEEASMNPKAGRLPFEHVGPSASAPLHGVQSTVLQQWLHK